jgi:hypothetical protein
MIFDQIRNTIQIWLLKMSGSSSDSGFGSRSSSGPSFFLLTGSNFFYIFPDPDPVPDPVPDLVPNPVLDPVPLPVLHLVLVLDLVLDSVLVLDLFQIRFWIRFWSRIRFRFWDRNQIW